MSQKKTSISTGILVSSVLGAALLAIAGIGFMQPTGEQSKLVYNGKLWCVSNYLEQEPQEILKDGRPRQDKLLDGKESWIVREQVEADSKEDAEAKAQKNGGGLFEPSDKTTMRAALSKNPADRKFFRTHFNKGATIAGPCLGGGSSTTVGMWLSEMIREDCFGITPTPTATATTSTEESSQVATTKCGEVVDSLVPGFKMIDKNGKLGHEEHLAQTRPSHYIGSDSSPTSMTTGGAFPPHTTEQERYYFNAQWRMFDWSGTASRNGHGVSLVSGAAAAAARNKIAHSRIVIKSVETGRTMVVSAEESGPAAWVTGIHGVNFGAPPEVYRYLGTSNPYTQNPNDGKGKIEVLGFAKDQSTPLGPCGGTK